MKAPARVLIAVAAVGGLFVASSAQAAGTVYGGWSASGSSGSFTGAVTVPADGFPDATFTSNGSGVSTPVSAFLNAATPFGADFGTSQGSNYLNVATAPAAAPSTTTITFATPTPATGWGLAFGDIDADSLQISAVGPLGPLASSQLGFQAVFNNCAFGSPLAPGCSGTETDVPTWDPATSTLIGNIVDTIGATGWFRPTAPITEITLTFTRTSASGAPIFQTWIATDTSDIAGTVTLDSGGPAPAGTTLQLLDASSSPVAAPTTPGADGTYLLNEVVSTVYTVQVVPPAGYQVVGPSTVLADAAGGDVTGVNFVLQATSPTTTTVAAPSTTRPRGLLPATGSTSGSDVTFAAITVGCGLVLLVVARRRAAG